MHGDVGGVGVIINDLINTVEMSTVNVVKSEPTKTVSHDGNEWLAFVVVLVVPWRRRDSRRE